MSKVSDPKPKTDGRCFEAALDLAFKAKDDGKTWVVHGMAEGGGYRHCHAWVEREIPGKGVKVFDGSLGYDGTVRELVILPVDAYRRIGKIEDATRYSLREARRLMAKTGHQGPWEKRYFKVTPLTESEEGEE